ncbi:MAG: beta-glucosidase BglX [Bacteroidales bacterium]
MNKKIVLGAFTAILLASGCTEKQTAWKSFSGDKRIEQRVDSVLALMTLEEKIGQMTQFSSHDDITGPVMSQDIDPYLRKGLVGSIFNAANADGIRQLQERALAESRLKIPVLFGYDVIHGFKTIFPMPLAESCSWDLALMEESAAIAAEEAGAAGLNWTFAPMVDIARDARWGRVMEGAGEDVYLGSLIAEARVKGFQGETWQDLGKQEKILACAKHFAAYGFAEAGRDYNTVDMSDRTLRETIFPPFEAAKKAGVATFMTAFNEIGGVPSTASKYLYTDVLRNEWNFNGFVVTDYTAINELVPHGVAKDNAEAAMKAANAGIDMDMTGGVFLEHLKGQVEAGLVKEETIDAAVRRILEMKFILGLFDDPYKYLDAEKEKATILKPEFLAASRKGAQRSIVLLKNDNAFFPIKKEDRKTVALIGPMVKNRISMNGEWAGRGYRDQSASLFDGLTEKYKDSNVKFIYAEGCDEITTGKEGFAQALAAARQADVILLGMGEDFNWSGEAASRTDIKLPGAQQDLLKELKKLGKPMGLVLMNGRPLDLSWEDENVDGIMEAWYLGTMAGHAMADVIAGDYNPSAKLTMSFPRNVGQLPLYYNQKNTGRPLPANDPKMDYKSSYLDVANTALYPFGHGLSYTTFRISDMKLDKTELKRGETLIITANVSNTGDVDGEEIVQLYIRDVAASVTRPVKELKGFSKIALKKGESREVKFTLTEQDLEILDLEMNKRAEAGDFKVWVATSSADESNEAAFLLKD